MQSEGQRLGKKGRRLGARASKPEGPRTGRWEDGGYWPGHSGLESL